MSIETLWFYLWGLLWGIYFITDGFDLGIGMLIPFLGKDEISKRALYNTTGPLWNGNEVWLISAGAVTFAAFPKTYAVMFSSFYIFLTLLLVVLIIRGISLEYRNKVDSSIWKNLCDICQFIGSGMIALLIGVSFANIFRGIPIQNGVFKGSFWGFLTPYCICGGIFFITIFLQHGVLWLLIKTEDPLQYKAKKIALALWAAVLVITVAFLVYSYIETNLYVNYLKYPVLFLIPLFAAAALISCRFYTVKNAVWKAWLSSATFILACTFFCIIGLFPNMLPSTIDPAVNSITYQDASSSSLTLNIMLGVLVVFIPLVLAYQTWAYILFSKKIKPEELVY